MADQRDSPSKNGHRSRGHAESARKRNDSGRGGRRHQVRSATHRTRGHTRPIYPEHILVEDAEALVARGELVKGTIVVNRSLPSNAYVRVKDAPRDILVPGFDARNRAMHGDTVAVLIVSGDERSELLEGKKRRKKTAEPERPAADEGTGRDDEEHLTAAAASLSIAEAEGSGASSAEEHEDEEQSEEVEDVHEEQPVGTVVSVLEERRPPAIPGTLRPSNARDRFIDASRHPHCMFVPLDVRYPRMVVPSADVPHDVATNTGMHSTVVFTARPVRWDTRSRQPAGELVRRLGNAGDVKVETEAIFAVTNVDSAPFSDATLASLSEFSAPWEIPREEIAAREDLRTSRRIFTIDPASARDLDDAVHIERVVGAEDTFEVGVHIADVSYFVRPGSAVDLEAQSRSTSVYLPHMVVPMLPAVLSEQLCSLNPNVDRLAFSVIWHMRADGSIVEDVPPRFVRSVIRSCARLDYETAQRIIDGASHLTAARVEEDVRALHRIAAAKRAQRFRDGALSFTRPKMRFDLDDETKEPIGIGVYQLRPSNHLIEEFMLLANFLAAGRLVQHAATRDAALLRRHSTPDERKMDNFTRFCRAEGFAINMSSSEAFHASVEAAARERRDRSLATIIEFFATKTMQLAEYFCVGADPEGHWTHYALDLPYYTHFTSPIRRYPDIVVHRLLAVSMDGAPHSGARPPPPVPHSSAVAEICSHANEKKLNARDAEIMAGHVFLVLAFQHEPLESDAVVISLGDKFVHFVELRFGLEGDAMLRDVPHPVRYDSTSDELHIQWGVEKGRKHAAEAEAAPSTPYRRLSHMRVRIERRPDTVPIELKFTILPPQQIR